MASDVKGYAFIHPVILDISQSSILEILETG